MAARKNRWIILAVVAIVLLLFIVSERSMAQDGKIQTLLTPGPTSSPAPQQWISPVAASILAGACTGIVETLMMYPLENLKTQQQLDSKPIIELFWRTWHAFGFFGLYRGMTPILIGAVPTQAIRWGSYEFMCSWRGCSTILDVFICGLVSGCFVAIATGIPMESMKTHMIHSLHTPSQSPRATPQPQGIQGVTPPSDFIAVSIDMNSKGHRRAMSSSTLMPPQSPVTPGACSSPTTSSPPSLWIFKGWVPTIFKKVLNQAIRFPVHSIFFRLFCGGIACVGQNHIVKGFLAGALAGLSSIVITQPVDVIKTRMQGINSERYGHSWRCAVILLQEEGVKVFFTGIYPRALRVALGAGITFSVFPIFKAMLFAWK